jgi:hypothetical protein
LINNKLIDNIVKEYDIDFEVLYECIAHACRKLYGVIEILTVEEKSIEGFIVNKDGWIEKKEIKITNNGMVKIVKETIKEIGVVTREDIKVLENMSYKSVLNLLEKDIETISKSPIKLRVLSTRSLSDKEIKSHNGAKLFVIVRASRFLNPSEKRYFKLKSESLKKGVVFVLG